MKSSPIIIFAGLLSLLCACDTTIRQQQRPMGLAHALKIESGQDGRGCVRIASIRGYGFERQVLRLDSGQNYYLAITKLSCPAMANAPAAVFDGPGGQICGGGASRVSTAGEHCIISHVFRFDSRDAAFSALNNALAALTAPQEGSSSRASSQSSVQ